MQALSSNTRSDFLAQLQEKYVDVLIIGGGVTGAGVALDAAARGYSVGLIEKSDFASGTSMKSTKLVHGGIRYLPNFDFALVREALLERGRLLRNAPFLVKQLGFVMPLYKGDRHPVGIPFTTPGGVGLAQLVDTGLWMYDFMAGKNNVHIHKSISATQVEEMTPALVTHDLQHGFIYYDAQTNDALLTLCILRTAVSYGARIANYAEVTEFLKDPDGRLVGVKVQDRLSPQTWEIRARHFVNAAGVFAGRIEELATDKPQISVEPSKGVHLIFSQEDIPIGDHAVILPETDDRRVLFLVPWQSRVLFGTTDTGSGDLDHPQTNPDDIDYLMEHLNRYLRKPLTRDHIISSYAGYRPLVKPRDDAHGSASLSRTHNVLQSPTGLVSIVGGKMTTYRQMAQDTVDVLSKRDGRPLRHLTRSLALVGSAGWETVRDRLALYGLPEDVVEKLIWSYGSEALGVLALLEQDPDLNVRLLPDLPYIRAQVVYACRECMAMSVEDVLTRRTSISFEDHKRGMGIAAEVGAMMAKELGWSHTRLGKQIKAYEEKMRSLIAAEQMVHA